MRIWTSLVRIWTLCNCEFNENFLTFGDFVALVFLSEIYWIYLNHHLIWLIFEKSHFNFGEKFEFRSELSYYSQMYHWFTDGPVNCCNSFKAATLTYNNNKKRFFENMTHISVIYLIVWICSVFFRRCECLHNICSAQYTTFNLPLDLTKFLLTLNGSLWS